MWPERVRSALQFVPGVICAHADMPSRTATVACATSCDRAALLAALEKRGYGGMIR